MGVNDLLTAINNDPEFQNQPYTMQKKIRSKLLASELPKEKGFSALTPQTQSLVFTKLVNTPPAFRDPILGQSLTEFGFRFKSEPFSQVDTNPEVITLKGIDYNMPKASYLDIEEGYKLSPAVADMQKFIGKEAFKEQLTLINLVGKGLSKVAQGIDAQGIADYLDNPDKRDDLIKAKQWYMELASSDDRKRAALGITNTLSTVGGFSLDLLSYYAATGIGGPSRLFTKAMGSVASKAASVPVTSLAKALPSFFRATGAGVTGVTRSFVDAMLEPEDRKEAEVSKAAENIALTFGEYAAFDYLFAAVRHGIWPLAKLATKSNVYGLLNKTIDDVEIAAKDIGWKNADIMKKDIDNFLAGTIDPVHYKALSQRQQDFIQMRKNVAKFASEDPVLLDLDPYRKLTITANNFNSTLIQDGNIYRFRPGNSKQAVIFNSVDEAYDGLGDYADIIRKGIKDQKARSAFESSYKDILARRVSRRAIDTAIEPFTYIQKGDPNYTPDVKKFHTNVRLKNKIPVTMRETIHPSELEILAKTNNTGLDKKVLRGSLSGDTFTLGAKSDQAVILNRIASRETLESTTKKLSNIAKNHPEINTRGSISDLVTSRLKETGFDGVDLGGGNIKVFYPKKSVKTISLAVDPNTGKPLVANIYKSGNSIKEGYILSKASKSLSEIQKSPRETVKMLSRNFSGKIKSDNVGRLISDLTGEPVSNIKVKLNPGLNTDGIVMIRKTGDNFLTVTMPTEVATRKALSRSLTDIVSYLNEPSHGAKNWKKLNYSKQQIASIVSPFELPFQDRNLAKVWVQSLIDNKDAAIYGVSGYYKMDDRTFASVGDITDYLIAKSVTPEQFKVDMFEAGMVYKKNRAGKFQVLDGNRVAYQSDTFEGLLEESGYVPSKVDSKFGPEATYVRNSDSSFDTYQKAVFGPRNKLIKYLDSFTDYSEEAKKKVIYSKGHQTLKTFGSSYEVVIPEIGERKLFSNPLAAKNYINNSEWKTYKELKQSLYKRQFRMSYQNGKYLVFGKDTTNTFDSLDQVQEFMKSNPVPSYAPEILGKDFTQEIQTVIDEQKIPVDWLGGAMARFDPVEFVSTDDIGLIRKIGHGISPSNDWILRTAEATGNKALKPLFSRSMEVEKIAKVEINKGSKIIHNIFKDSKGKVISRERREAIFHLMTANEHRFDFYGIKRTKPLKNIQMRGLPEIREKIIKDWNLTPDEINIADKARAFLGKTETGGLFNKFGIDNEKFVVDYLPRIRNYVDEDILKNVKYADMDEILRGALGDSFSSREIKFWAENARLSEVVNFAQETDPLALLLKYNSQGHKRFYLNDIWDSINGYMKANAKNIPPQLMLKVQEYRDVLYGIGKTQNEELMQSLGMSVFKAMGMNKPAQLRAGKGMMDAIYGTSYVANMGWRTYLPVRNIMQVYTTLGPRFGNQYVNKAIQNVANATGEKIAYLKSVGVIREAPPIVNELFNADSKLSKLTGWALKPFKNSDDITRAVAFEATSLRFQEGLEKFQKGIIGDIDSFSRYTAVNLLDDSITNEIKTLVRAGDPDSIARAQYLYGSTVADETMFIYDKVNSPTLYRGVIGRLFGQYGTYSAGFRDNIIKGLTRGSKGQRAAYISRMAANSAALYGAFRLAGIRSENFLPWTPSGFSGGPMFNIGIDMVKTMSPSYEADQAKARLSKAISPVNVQALMNGEVKGQLPTAITPGYYQIRGMKKFLEYIDKEDYWKAYLALTTAPIREDYNIMDW